MLSDSGQESSAGSVSACLRPNEKIAKPQPSVRSVRFISLASQRIPCQRPIGFSDKAIEPAPGSQAVPDQIVLGEPWSGIADGGR